MRHFTCLALITRVIMLASCSKDAIELTSQDNEEEYVTLNFTPYTVESLTRGATSSISSVASHLDVWIINGTDTMTFHQTSSSDAFGTISVVLKRNEDYQMIALAHSRTGNATFSNNVLAYPEDKVGDSFLCCGSVLGGEASNNYIMKRIVGQFRLEINDVIPEEVTQMKFTVKQTGTRMEFNGLLMSPTNIIDREILYSSFTRNNTGGGAFTLSIIPTLQNTSCNFDIQVDALTAEDEVYLTRTLTDVPIKSNYKTTYAGKFFTGSMSGSFVTDDEWESFDAVEY